MKPDSDWLRPEWHVDGVQALMTTRHGGVSTGVFSSMNLRDDLGDDASAALMRDDAWREYVSAPGFQRRKERFWAWRARPSRPATYLLIFALCFSFFATVIAPKISTWSAMNRHGGTYTDPSLMDPGDEE